MNALLLITILLLATSVVLGRDSRRLTHEVEEKVKKLGECSKKAPRNLSFLVTYTSTHSDPLTKKRILAMDASGMPLHAISESIKYVAGKYFLYKLNYFRLKFKYRWKQTDCR